MNSVLNQTVDCPIVISLTCPAGLRGADIERATAGHVRVVRAHHAAVIITPWCPPTVEWTPAFWHLECLVAGVSPRSPGLAALDSIPAAAAAVFTGVRGAVYTLEEVVEIQAGREV